MTWWNDLKTRYADLVAEYGMVALGTWLTLALVTFISLVVAIRLGVHIESAAGSAGTFGAAYVGLQLTKPFRIAATLVLTPIVATTLRRRRDTPEAMPEVVPERID